MATGKAPVVSQPRCLPVRCRDDASKLKAWVLSGACKLIAWVGAVLSIDSFCPLQHLFIFPFHFRRGGDADLAVEAEDPAEEGFAGGQRHGDPEG